MKFIQWIQRETDKLIKSLYHMLTEQNASSEVVRCAITFLDIWQAIIILNHNYWIPQLIDITTPIYYYTIFSCILATLAVLALIFHRMLWLSILVLGLNTLLYMGLAFAGLSYYDPPRASVGFSFFVMLISISAFWRVMLLFVRNRAIRKRN